jgi:tetratricopeptide (TPR) repeat protein
MKTLAKGILTVALIFSINFVFGQMGVEDGSRYGHGEDSIRCIRNMSLYREYARQKNYDLAKEPWAIVFTECPKATKYMYLDGIKMIEADIKKAEDDVQKEVLIDSMMKIYDQRIKYYKQKGFVLGLKGVDYIKYSKNTVENMQKGYGFLKESVKLQKQKSGPAELLTYMQASNSLYKAQAIEAGDVVADFGAIIEITDLVIKSGSKKAKNMKMVKASVEKIFEESGAANCDDLVPFYAKKYEETPEDAEFLKKATDLLRSTKCTDSDLFFNMAEKLNSIEPSAKLAKELAKISNQKDKLEVAARYYKQAIEMQNDNIEKANYYLELGDVTRRLGNYSQARTYALNSIELNPANGYPYLLIGNIYAASSKSCGEDDFEQKTVYWAAVDKFAKAKSIDPELASDANKFIEAYRPHFPDTETIFFYGLKVGDTYTVGCWINEATTVRSR